MTMENIQFFTAVDEDNECIHLFKVNLQREELEWIYISSDGNNFIYHLKSILFMVRLGMYHELKEISCSTYNDLLSDFSSQPFQFKSLSINDVQRYF